MTYLLDFAQMMFDHVISLVNEEGSSNVKFRDIVEVLSFDAMDEHLIECMIVESNYILELLNESIIL